MYSVSPVQAEDLKQIAQIESRVHISPWSYDVMRTSLNSGQFGFKIEIEHKVAAYCFVLETPDVLEVLNIAVDVPFRRWGLARTMIDFVCQKGRVLGKTAITLEARESNKAAQALYLKLGFVQKGRRKNYYSTVQGKEDALLYHRNLVRAEKDLSLGI